jgi:hypothetical protein
MTSMLTPSATEFLARVSIPQLSETVGIVALAILLIVLVEREILIVAGSPSQRDGVLLLEAIAVPLLLVFAVLVLARFVSLA